MEIVANFLPIIESFLFILILNDYEHYRAYESAKNHINGIEWSFAKRRLASFNKISNGLKNFMFIRANFGGIKNQICMRL